MSSSTSHNHNHKRHHLHHHNTTSNLMWEAQKEKSLFEVGSEREKMGRFILCSSLITLSSREIFPLLNFSADQCFISIYTKQMTFPNFISLFVCWNIWQTCKPLHIFAITFVIIAITMSSLPLPFLPPLPLPIQVVPSSQYLRCCPAPLTHSGYHWDQMIVTQLRSNLMLMMIMRMMVMVIRIIMMMASWHQITYSGCLSHRMIVTQLDGDNGVLLATLWKYSFRAAPSPLIRVESLA